MASMNGSAGAVGSSQAGTLSQAEVVRTTVAYLKQLTVDKLKKVLRDEGLPLSGLKNELQRRLISHVYTYDAKNDLIRLRKIHNVVKGLRDGYSASSHNYSGGPPQPAAGYPSPYSNHTPASSASPQTYYNSPDHRVRAQPSIPTMPNFNGVNVRPTVTFKNSPFYSIVSQLGQTVELRIRETTRDTARITINLDHNLAQKFSTDTSCRAMIFCAVETYDSAFRPSDITFPAHAELKCNHDDVKSNLKGLKNKPGSTRPVDITPFLRKKANFPNSVELIYALTTKKYFLMAYQVQKKPIEALVRELKSGKYFSKERVIRDMKSEAEDDDLVTEYSRMSLKDPVQMTRIETPCRSLACKHNDCFDASVYLALQEQAPTWTCPICSKPATWENLVFDQFFHDILLNTPKDIEQVRVEPDGRWSLIKEEEDDEASSNQNQRQDSGFKHNDSDDDLIEITNLDRTPSMTASLPTRHSPAMVRTPPFHNGHNPFSMSQSSSHNQPPPSYQEPSVSKKRPREDNVIDLTLSDDDEPPVSRVKRPSVNPSLSDFNNRPDGSPAPFRFSLPPPPARTNTGSPGLLSDYDRFMTTRL